MIKKIELKDFRSFKKKEINIGPNITAIVGKNGAGKTNILEAVNYLATGKSFKARKESEVINYEASLASILGHTQSDKLDIKITTGENGWPRKKLMINDVPKRLIDFAGRIKTVLFSPQDMDLVTQSPSLRRKFLDNVLSQNIREYHRSLISYEKGVRQRNKLLFRIRENLLSTQQLLFWNQLLIKEGNYIFEKRKEFIEFVNDLGKCNLVYDYSAITEKRLEQYEKAEVASATTLVGPHRDDFSFRYEARELSSFGSRGEQRMAVLWLKMAELEYIKKINKHDTQTSEPEIVLLLDDIFSELDHSHRELVMEIIKSEQTVITTADEHFIDFKIKNSKIKVINL